MNDPFAEPERPLGGRERRAGRRIPVVGQARRLRTRRIPPPASSIAIAPPTAGSNSGTERGLPWLLLFWPWLLLFCPWLLSARVAVPASSTVPSNIAKTDERTRLMVTPTAPRVAREAHGNLAWRTFVTTGLPCCLERPGRPSHSPAGWVQESAAARPTSAGRWSSGSRIWRRCRRCSA